MFIEWAGSIARLFLGKAEFRCHKEEFDNLGRKHIKEKKE